MWLITKTPAAQPHAQWRCRNSGSIASISSLVYEGHLWVGWKSTDADNQILSINAWEVPEPFSPLIDTSVSSMLSCWFRADLNTISQEIINGTAIDQSSQRGNMAANSGLIDRSGCGGRPFMTVYKSTASYLLGGAVLAAPSVFTVFAVITPRSDPSGGYVPVFELSDGAGSASHPSTGGGGIRSQGTQWGAWADDPALAFCGSTLTVDKTYIVCARVSATDVYWYVNGLQVATVGRVAASGASAVFSGFNGWVSADVPGAEGDFDLAEGLIYDADLSTDERAFVLEYLNRRYGVF